MALKKAFWIEVHKDGEKDGVELCEGSLSRAHARARALTAEATDGAVYCVEGFVPESYGYET